MENTTPSSTVKLQERLAKLSGGVAVIKVGAATETELKEIKHRVEDALQATRAAVEEGIVAGGGVAFMDALPALENIEISDPEEQIGIDIIKKALTAPVATIAKNAGFEGAVVVDKVCRAARRPGPQLRQRRSGVNIDPTWASSTPSRSPAPPCRTPPPSPP